ncbi:hypothetical protein [Microbispora catharanthi]|uniref:Uncharacterized protein n=1 Tax=Microbispora catharanthi TaxID=1712871 RepID=A0A5N6BNW1_9ACTN|nr:hypothetical protein [Microbispora catharanthi]KAB8181878.1 hypothetical protein FH610_025875 [Microbispora catharanthi]
MSDDGNIDGNVGHHAHTMGTVDHPRPTRSSMGDRATADAVAFLVPDSWPKLARSARGAQQTFGIVLTAVKILP